MRIFFQNPLALKSVKYYNGGLTEVGRHRLISITALPVWYHFVPHDEPLNLGLYGEHSDGGFCGSGE